MNKKKALFFLFTVFLFFAFNSVFSQSGNWQLVIGGIGITEPKKASYGFITITDGRMLIGVSSTGKKLWEKPISRRPSTMYTVTENDFIYVVSYDNKYMSLHNPDGHLLWEIEVEDSIKYEPIIGYDGRVFVQGEKYISCYGITGTRKWHVELDRNTILPLSTLNDGSIIALCTAENGMTVGYRISPFGSYLERITFAGTVISTLPISSGLALGFSDGTVGCCSVVSNKAESIWAIKNSFQITNTDKVFISLGNTINTKTNSLYVITSSKTISYIDINKQQVIWTNTISDESAQITDISLYEEDENVIISYKQNSNIFITCYTKNGIILWQRKFNSKNLKKEFIVYVGQGSIALLTEDWLITSYRIYQQAKRQNAITSYPTPTRKKYEKYSNSQTTKIPDIDTIINKLRNGNYGEQEEIFISYITENLSSLITSFSTSSYISSANPEYRDPIYDSKLITAACFLDIDLSSYISAIFQNTNDTSTIKTLLAYSIKNGYDPYRAIIFAIENNLQKNIRSNLDDTYYTGICDAVYSICKTMGSPVLYNQGKDILTKMITSNIKTTVRSHVLLTLDKIIRLQI